MKIFVACAVCCAVMLQGCASSGEASFAKSNVSPVAVQRDAAQCLQQASKKEVPENAASENTAAAFIVGGLVGVAINHAANEDAYRGSVRDKCMAKRGYNKVKAG